MFDIGLPCGFFPLPRSDTSVRDLLQKPVRDQYGCQSTLDFGSVPGCSSMFPDPRFKIDDCVD